MIVFRVQTIIHTVLCTRFLCAVRLWFCNKIKTKDKFSRSIESLWFSIRTKYFERLTHTDAHRSQTSTAMSRNPLQCVRALAARAHVSKLKCFQRIAIYFRWKTLRSVKLKFEQITIKSTGFQRLCTLPPFDGQERFACIRIGQCGLADAVNESRGISQRIWNWRIYETKRTTKIMFSLRDLADAEMFSIIYFFHFISIPLIFIINKMQFV